MVALAENDHWTETSPLFVASLEWRARPSPLICKNEYLVYALVEGTAIQAIVGTIVWAFHRLKSQRSRKKSDRPHALHSVRARLSFLLF